MPRPPSEDTRRALIEEAAARLARREPVTLRSLAAAVGVSTIAIYTYFDGMPGLWARVRQAGFDRLRDRLAAVPPHRDPVRRLAALGVAYVESAIANPALYRAMFDAAAELPDPAGAGASFELLVDGARAAQREGRFDPGAEPRDVATRFWASGHGLTSLTVGGVLPASELVRHAPEVGVAVFTAAGDDPLRARRSVTAAWREHRVTVER
jgi:AcrR family transcriptional regulator